MLPYIMFAAVIFLAIAITLFACVRWIFVKENWSPVNAIIESAHLVRNGEDNFLAVEVTYVFDDMMYRASIRPHSLDPDDYIAGRILAILVNPKRPDRFNVDKNYSFQKTQIAKWLESKLVTINRT